MEAPSDGLLDQLIGKRQKQQQQHNKLNKKDVSLIPKATVMPS